MHPRPHNGLRAGELVLTESPFLDSRAKGRRMKRTERALEAVSKAVREATWAFEREMLGVEVDDLPTPVIRKLSTATDR
jgi:hypothetical protein